MTAQEKAILVAKAASDKKADDVVMLELTGLTLVADYFVIASGNSIPQVQAIAQNIMGELGKVGKPELRVAGYSDGNWVLVDCGDVVAHIFLGDQREFYGLERLWRDAKKIEYRD
jgi:ribosome-associated protein